MLIFSGFQLNALEYILRKGCQWVNMKGFERDSLWDPTIFYVEYFLFMGFWREKIVSFYQIPTRIYDLK